MYVQVIEGWRPRGVGAAVGDRPLAVDGGVALPRDDVAGLLSAHWTPDQHDPTIGVVVLVWRSPDDAAHADLRGALAPTGSGPPPVRHEIHLGGSPLTPPRGMDPLTGLADHATLVAAAEACAAHAADGETACTLILLDVDGLKDINDSFGHLAGDSVLKHVAMTLRAYADDADVLARHGGDEFAVLVPHRSGDNLTQILDRYAPALAPMLYRDEQTGHAVVLSSAWGTATLVGSSDVRALFRQADAELIRRKSTVRPPWTDLALSERPFVPRGRRALAEALSSLLDMVREVAKAQGEDEFLRRAATRAAELVGTASATVSLIETHQRGGVRATRAGDGWEYHPGEQPAAKSVITHVRESGVGYYSNDLPNDPYADQHAVARLHLTSCLCVPLRDLDGGVRGTFFLSNKLGRAPFNDHDLRLVQAFADLAAIAAQTNAAVLPLAKQSQSPGSSHAAPPAHL